MGYLIILGIAAIILPTVVVTLAFQKPASDMDRWMILVGLILFAVIIFCGNEVERELKAAQAAAAKVER